MREIGGFGRKTEIFGGFCVISSDIRRLIGMIMNFAEL